MKLGQRSVGIFATLLALSFGPHGTQAQVNPLGPEFAVNTFFTGSQSRPEVAAAANGDFVTVWIDVSSRDGSDAGIFGQRFDSSGIAVGTDFQINTYTTGNQGNINAGVAAVANGDFLVVWDSLGQDGSDGGIFGQLFASNGSAVGTEFLINTYTTGYQDRVAVAVANDTFVVVWESLGQLVALETDVFAQRYDSSGGALGTEFQVNTYTTGYQYLPDVAGMSNGEFVMVWGSFEISNPSNGDVIAQRFASDGTMLGTEFQVNVYTTSTSGGARPSVASAPNDSFVISWNNSADQDGDYTGVFARVFDSAGVAQTGDLQVNTYTTGGQFRSQVAATNDDFVVVWESSDQDTSQVGVFGQRFDSSGNTAGTEFQVNTYTFGHQNYSAITFTNDDFVVVWQGGGAQDTDLDGIFAKRYALAEPTPPPVGCALVPLSTCTTPGKSLLLIKDTNQDGAGVDDRLIWKWLKGPQTVQTQFGDPVTTAEYRLCLYSGSGQALTVEVTLPPGDMCAGQPCWKEVGTKGYKRKDTAAATDGISLVLLKGGDADKSKIVVKGKDGNLPLTPTTLSLPFSADVIVQLSNTETTDCWESIFPPTSFLKNEETGFKAKSQ